MPERRIDLGGGAGRRARRPVVAALHLVPAAALGDLDARRSRTDVLVVGDDDDARTVVLDLVDGIPDLRAFDAGSLANALGARGLRRGAARPSTSVTRARDRCASKASGTAAPRDHAR